MRHAVLTLSLSDALGGPVRNKASTERGGRRAPPPLWESYLRGLMHGGPDKKQYLLGLKQETDIFDFVLGFRPTLSQSWAHERDQRPRLENCT